jgi:hypothetical protein
MGVLDFFKRRGKGKELTEQQKISIHSIFSGESSRSLSEREDAALLGINREMIHDDSLEKWLEKLSVLKSEEDEPIVDMNMMALRIKSSCLIRTSFVDPIDARIHMLEAEQFVERVELDMDEDTYDYGGTNFLEAVKDVIVTGWSDSVNGRKAKLLKVTSKAFEVSVPEQQQKQKVMP